MILYQPALVKRTNQSMPMAARIFLAGSLLKISVYNLEGERSVSDKEEPWASDELDLKNNRYTSWFFAVGERFRKAHAQFIPVHALTAAAKIPASMFEKYILGNQIDVFFQIDIGMVQENNSHLAIKTLRIPQEKLDLTGFGDIEFVTYDREVFSRKALWDRCALQINDRVSGADEQGNILLGESLEVKNSADYLEVIVRKYTSDFSSPLCRAVDDETVFVETTAGIINTSRVQLVNGAGKFRFYPLGFTGKFKLKLGWKYFSGWSEYEINIRE